MEKGPYNIPNIFPQRSLHTPQCMSHHTLLCHYRLLHFCMIVSLSLGATRRFFDGVFSFVVHLDTHFVASIFITFTQSFDVWHHHVDVVVLLWLFVLLWWLYLWVFFILSLFIAPTGIYALPPLATNVSWHKQYLLYVDR